MEPTSGTEFEHFHKINVDHLELIGRRMSDGLGDNDPKALHEEFERFVTGLAQGLRRARGPKEALRLSIDGLSNVERKRYVLNNVLESLKRGDTASKIFARFKTLGLLSSDAPYDEPKDRESPAAAEGVARAVERLDKGLRRAASVLVRICGNALKALPQFVEVEFGVTLIGGFPAPTLTLKGASMNLQELFDTLTRDDSWSENS